MASPRTIPKPGRTLAGLFVIMAVLTGVMLAQGRSTPKLALDLAGGTTVTLTAVTQNGKTPPAQQMDKAVQIIRNRVNGLGVSEAEVSKQGGNNIVVGIPGANAAQTLATVGTTAKLQFRQVYAETSGTPQPVTPTPSGSPSKSAAPSAAPSGSPTASAAASASASPKGRALSQALTAPTPPPSPSGPATPPAPATPSPAPSSSTPPAAALGLPSDVPPAVIQEYAQANCSKPDKKLAGSNDENQSWVASCGQDGRAKYLLGPVRVKGEQIASATAVPPNPQQGQTSWTVSMTFKKAGADQFYRATQDAYKAYQTSSTSPQAQVAIVLDGLTVSAPSISNGPIGGGNAQIYGPADSFTQDYATNLANVLNYGALPLEFKTSSTVQVSSTLGTDQLNGGLLAGAIGLALVVLYSLLYYQGLGIVSVLSLAIAGGTTWLAVVILGENVGFRLSLSHIIGLIVSIGITADSFIVYFERLRDELREGRPLRPSVEKAWMRARRTILVADAVTFIAAVVLYALAVGGVAGFAFAMGLTTLIDVIVVFFFTKPMVSLFARLSFFNRGHKLSGLDPGRLRKTSTNARTAPTGQEA